MVEAVASCADLDAPAFGLRVGRLVRLRADRCTLAKPLKRESPLIRDPLCGGRALPVVMRIISIVIAISLLGASEASAGQTIVPPPTTKSEYETAIRQFAVIFESHIASISELLPASLVPAFHKSQSEWEKSEDLRCLRSSRNASDELAELRCLLEASQVRYEELESQLSALESSQERD